MKVLAYILTAAAVFIGADVFVKVTYSVEPVDSQAVQEAPLRMSLHGGSGIPTPPPD